MPISRDDVIHVAKLARIELDDDEIDLFSEQLSVILDHAARVQALDTNGVEPTAHPIELANVLRADEPRADAIDRSAVLSAAPDTEDGYFRVPRILGDDGSTEGGT